MTDNRRIRIGDVPRNPRVTYEPPRQWGKAIDFALSIAALVLFAAGIALAMIEMGG